MSAAPVILALIALGATAWMLADLRRHRRRLARWRTIQASQERAVAARLRPRTGNVDNLGPR